MNDYKKCLSVPAKEIFNIFAPVNLYFLPS